MTKLTDNTHLTQNDYNLLHLLKFHDVEVVLKGKDSVVLTTKDVPLGLNNDRVSVSANDKDNKKVTFKLSDVTDFLVDGVSKKVSKEEAVEDAVEKEIKEEVAKLEDSNE